MQYTKTKSSVENYSETLSRDQELASNTRTSALSRLVWYAAIAGFIIVNAKPFWEAVRGQPLLSYQLIWYSLPWMVTALFAIVTHILIDEVTVNDNVYYSTKKSYIGLHKIDVDDNQPNPEEWHAILFDTNPELKRLRSDLDKSFNRAKQLERITHISLIVSFISVVAFPLAF